jgi:hypothetical protein
VGAGGAELEPVALDEREQPAARLALLDQRVGDVLPAPRADLDLGRDQLARDRVGEDRIVLRGGLEVLEAVGELERRRVEDRVLLLDAHGEVGRGVEGLAGGAKVDGHGAYVR